MPVDNTIAKARAEFENGQKWRAKEIIRSSLGNYGYNLELYQFYGEVLLSMDDLQQAGKYLFFSKKDLSVDEQRSVDLFLERHGKKGHRGVLSSLRTANFKTLSEYPDFVQERLKALGAKEDLYGLWDRVIDNDGNIVAYGCLVIAIVLATFCVIGAVTVFKSIFE